MTGAEHIAAAEQLLDQAAIDGRDPMRKYAEDANVIAAAQVHATLAVAAFTRDVADGAKEAGSALGWWANDGVLPVRVKS